MRYHELTQKLDEIERGGGLDDHDFPDKLVGKEFPDNQLDLFKEIPSGQPNVPENYKIVGRMGELFVARRKETGGYVTHVWFNRMEAVSYVSMAPYDRQKTNYPQHAPHAPELTGTGYRVHAVQVAEKFQGSRLGPEMYRWLLTNVCDYIMADDTQTGAGEALWKRLRKTKGLAVEVWDAERYDSFSRKKARDFDQVYNKMHLIPWVTLTSKLDYVRRGEDA